LTHGVLGVWQGKKDWLFTLRHGELGSGQPVRTHALPRIEAYQMLERLTDEVHKLGERVRSMQTTMKPKASKSRSPGPAGTPCA
jgi:hypothetical protein